MAVRDVVAKFTFRDTPVEVIEYSDIPFPGVEVLDGVIYIDDLIYSGLSSEKFKNVLWLGKVLLLGKSHQTPDTLWKIVIGETEWEETILAVMALHQLTPNQA